MLCNSNSQDFGNSSWKLYAFRNGFSFWAVEVAGAVSMFCEGWFVVWFEIRRITVWNC